MPTDGSSSTSLTARIVAASQGRDRVLDAVKAVALVVVIVGHSLAWHVDAGARALNVLEVEPRLVVLTWVFQVLPLFFAAGAVSNAESARRHGTREYVASRLRRLLTPVLVYAAVWSAVLLPLSSAVPMAHAAGVFLAQLLWFAGVYLIVVAAAPWTSRWVTRPCLVLPLWGAAVVAVDVARVQGAPEALGWLNLLLVWGLMHQVGYHLPALRRSPAAALWLGAVAALGSAVALATIGPWSSSLVTVGNDPELSNLAPPSVVLALVGVAQILVLAACWSGLARLLDHDRVWAVVAIVGSRGMGMYLWHIPLVAVAAGLALATGWAVPPLTPAWWTVHLLVVVVVVPAAWVLAGAARLLERPAERRHRVLPLPVLAAAVVGGLAVLDLSVTGFATWAGSGMLGLPAATLPLLVALGLCWQSALSARSTTSPGDAAPRGNTL